MPASRSRSTAIDPSRPVGVRISTRCSSADGAGEGRHFASRRSVAGLVLRHAGEDAPELPERFAHLDGAVRQPELADRPFVFASALFHDGNRLPDFAARFEIPEQQHGIGQVARVHRASSCCDPIRPWWAPMRSVATPC